MKTTTCIKSFLLAMVLLAAMSFTCGGFSVAQMTDRASQERQRVKIMTAKMRKLWREIQAEGPRWEKAQ
jgi:hypothetical protein